ncbi:MAG: DUF721 domain-containing protein [Pseudanabaena sp. ELA607]
MAWTTVGKILSQLPNQTTWQQRCRLLHIHNYWTDLVGASVAQQSEPETVVKGILYVNVSSPIWANALTFERLRLLEKINQQLGKASLLPIDDIRFSTAKWATQRAKKTTVKPDLSAHPSWYKINLGGITLKNNNSGNVSLSNVDSGNIKSSKKLILGQRSSQLGSVLSSPVTKITANHQLDNQLDNQLNSQLINPPVTSPLLPAKPPENALEALERWRKLVKQQEIALVHCPKCQRHCPQGEVNRWQMCRVCATYTLFR